MDLNINGYKTKKKFKKKIQYLQRYKKYLAMRQRNENYRTWDRNMEILGYLDAWILWHRLGYLGI